MKKELTKVVTGLTGAAVLLSGCSAPAIQPVAPAEPAAVAPAAEAKATAGYEVVSREAEVYDEIANVKGEFSFEQDVMTPADEVFSLFGTAATAMCAKPGFAFGEADLENYYINVSGAITKTRTISLNSLKEQGTVNRVLKCSCATGAPVANASVVGVPLQNLVEMVDLEEGVNTVTVKDGEGYGLPMPLSYVLDHGALLAYQIDDKAIAEGVQLWMPQATARYFTRQVMEVEFSREETVPQMQPADDAQRAKVSVLNRFDDTFSVGDQITFEGYADDFDIAIEAVEFSLDGGKTWTACSTEGATADKWVYWHFGYTTEAPGTYKLDVRARTAEGRISPLASSVVFTVE